MTKHLSDEMYISQIVKDESKKMGKECLSADTQRSFSISFENKMELLKKWDAEYHKRRRRNIIIFSVIAFIALAFLALLLWGYIHITYINRTYEGYMWVQGELEEGYEKVTVKINGKGKLSSYYDLKANVSRPCLSFIGDVTVLNGDKQLYHYSGVFLDCSGIELHFPWPVPLDKSIPTISAAMNVDAYLHDIIIYPFDEDDQYKQVDENKYVCDWDSAGSIIIYASRFDDKSLSWIDSMHFSSTSHYIDYNYR